MNSYTWLTSSEHNTEIWPKRVLAEACGTIKSESRYRFPAEWFPWSMVAFRSVHLVDSKSTRNFLIIQKQVTLKQFTQHFLQNSSLPQWHTCATACKETGSMGGSPGNMKLILQPFGHFTYVTAHSPTLPSLYLRHRSFSNPSVASPTSQLIL